MSVGKYSPTVSNSYRVNQEWFSANCNVENQIYDNDGYDRYGYNEAGLDRAGYSEEQYLEGSYDEDGEFLGHVLYDIISDDWSDRILF